MQISVRRPGKHDPGAGVPDCRRQSAMIGVEGPEDHPVRANRYGGARSVMGLSVAVLRRATEHVAKPWRRVRRLGLAFKQILEPLHAQGVDTHRRIADDIFIAGHADPLVRALSQDLGHAALLIHLGDRRVLGNHGRPRSHGACNSDRADLLLAGFRSDAAVGQSDRGVAVASGAGVLGLGDIANRGHRRSEERRARDERAT